MNISSYNTSIYSPNMYVSGTYMNYTFSNTSFTSRNITTSIRNLYFSSTNTSVVTNYLDLQGITVNTNCMNANISGTSTVKIEAPTTTINSTSLNASISNVSLVSYNVSINASFLSMNTNQNGIVFSSNPQILNSTLTTQDNSNLVPTTNWVKNYVTSQSGSLVGSGGGSNSSTVAYGVNLLQLNRYAPDYSGSTSNVILPTGTTRVSILMLGAGGAAGSNVNTTDTNNVSVGIGGAGGAGSAIYYPSIQCNFSTPFTINFSTQLNGVNGAKGTILSYSTNMLNAMNTSLAQPIIAIAYGGGDGISTTTNVSGAQGTPGTGIIYYTYGQSVCQPGSLNISGGGQFFTGPKSTSKTLTNYGGQNILSYETNSTYLENVGGSQQIIYNGTNSTFTTNTTVAGGGAVYVWCWNDSSMLLVNTPNTFNVSNGLGTQYNQMNSLSQVISYKDTFTGPSKVLTFSNVSGNCSLTYIDNIENKHLDLYTIGGFKFNASLTNMDIYSNNPVSALKVSIGNSVTTINGVENTIQLGNANVITRMANLDSLTATSNLTIGSTQTTGGITIGSGTAASQTLTLNANTTNMSTMKINASSLNINSSTALITAPNVSINASNLTINTNNFGISFSTNPQILNSTLATQDNSNLVPTTNWVKNYLTSQSGALGNSSTVNASTVNTSNLYVNGSNAVVSVLSSLGLSVNSNNVLRLDTSGNTTVANQTNATIMNASSCTINSSSMFINSNGYNNLFSDNSGNLTLGDPYGKNNIMGDTTLKGQVNVVGTNWLRFGNGNGPEYGTIGVNNWDTPGLQLVGTGTASRNIYLYDNVTVTGPLNLQQPIAPSYSYPVAAGRIGEVIKSTNVIPTITITSTSQPLCSIDISIIGVYIITINMQIRGGVAMFFKLTYSGTDNNLFSYNVGSTNIMNTYTGISNTWIVTPTTSGTYTLYPSGVPNSGTVEFLQMTAVRIA